MSIFDSKISKEDLLNSMTEVASLPEIVELVSIPDGSGGTLATVIPALKFNNVVYVDGYQVNKFLFPDTAVYEIQVQEYQIVKDSKGSGIKLSESYSAVNPSNWKPLDAEAQTYFLTSIPSVEIDLAYDDDELKELRYYEYRIVPWISGKGLQGAPPNDSKINYPEMFTFDIRTGARATKPGKFSLTDPGAYAIVGAEATGKSYWLRTVLANTNSHLWRIGEREYPSATPSFAGYSRMIHEMCISSSPVVGMDSLAYISLIGAMDAGFQKGGISRDPVQLLGVLQSVFRDQGRIAFFVINPLSSELDYDTATADVPESFMSALRGGTTGTLKFVGNVETFENASVNTFNVMYHGPPDRKYIELRPSVQLP